MLAAVENVPQLRTLILGVPLPERIPMGEKPFFRTRLFFVAPPASKCGIVITRLKTVKQGNGLQSVAAGMGTGLFLYLAGINGLLYRSHHQFRAQFRNKAIPILHRFREIMAGVHVHERERQTGGIKCLLCQMRHDDGILAS